MTALVRDSISASPSRACYSLLVVTAFNLLFDDVSDYLNYSG